MQSRSDFLSTGLVPVTDLSSLPTDGCSICTDPFQTPIALPCKHIFCKQCALDWLSLPSRNTCPFCRFECFPLTTRRPSRPTPSAPPAATPAQTALITQAASRITAGNFDIFSDDISWDTASLQTATVSATRWLTTQTEVLGPAYIHKRRLGHSILVMGNLLKTYARLSGRPYTAREVGEWRIICTKVSKPDMPRPRTR